MTRLLAVFKGKTDSFWIQLLRYTFVGGLAFLVDFGALYVFTVYAQIHYMLSAALAFGLGLATNYCISILWVFNTRTIRNRGVELAIFAGLGVLGLGINELVMYVATESLGLFFMVSKVVATGFTYAWNFLSRKVILFSMPAEDREVVFASKILDLKV
jgi:putative flippase GtrA